jgi:hypothetical protein
VRRAWSSRRASRSERLCQKERDVGGDEALQFLHRGERLVGNVATITNVIEQFRQAGFAVAGPCSDVDELGDVDSKPVLLLQARDRHAGTDPAVLKAVDPDEQVALGQVCAVEVVCRMRPSPGFEHDWREVECEDGLSDRSTFGLHFLERGTDEDAYVLVWGEDHGSPRCDCYPGQSVADV